jgi:hypothetical protein
MDVYNWINQRFGVALNEGSLNEIKDFSLIWNVFENTVCNNNFRIDRVETWIAARGFNLTSFTSHLQYFQNRYISNGQPNQRFSALHFRPNDRADFVLRVLLSELTSTNETLLALVIIIYRFRNNLFHGLKDIRVIDEQRTNFENANSFLMHFLDQY